MTVRKAIGLAAAAVLLGGGIAVYWIGFAPNTPPFEDSRTVKIPPGASFEQIVDSLEASEVLATTTSFRLFAAASGWYRQIKPGLYRIHSGTSNLELMNRLRRGEQDAIRVTIPSGIHPGILARRTAASLYTDSTAVRHALEDSSLAAQLGTDTNHLFGYMRPDTYQFYWLSGAEDVIRRLKNAFDNGISREMQARADSLGLTMDEVIRLASIVEWEAYREDEKSTIAGVYLNRLEIGMPLQADPTVQYAIMQQNNGAKRRLLYEDYRIAHPYNTYNYRGLPPGPVTNPAFSTVEAVLNAEDHEYRFFVADGSGGHIFSRTFDEHRRAAAKYRRLMHQERND
jgi:UPF0755 protein